MGDIESSFRSIFKGGSLVFLGRVLELGISFVGAALIARFVGQTGYGTLALGSTLLSVLVTVSLIGVNTGVGRYLPRSDEPSFERGVLVSALQLTLPVALVVTAVVYLFATEIATIAFTDPSTAPVLRVFAIAIPVTVLTRLTLGVARGSQEPMPKVYLQNLSLPISRLSFAVVALLFGAGELGVAWAYTLARFLTAGLAVYYLLKHTRLLERISPDRMHVELLTFSAPFTITTIMSKVLKDFDTFLVGYFSTTGAVGSYNVAYQLALLITIFSMGFGYMLMPVLSEHHAQEEWAEVRRIYEVGAKWMSLASLPVFFAIAFFAPVVIRWTFGGEFVSGASALSVLAAGFLFSVVTGPSSNALMVMGYSKRIMYNNIFVTLLNVGLNLILIPRYGIVGAAGATTVSYTLLNLLYTTQLYRSASVHAFTGSLLKPGLSALGSMIVVYLVVTELFGVSLLSLIVGEFLFAVVLGVLVLRLGAIEREEVMIIDSIEDYFDIDLTTVKEWAKRLM
jgi:O-antigen/teichoic acid export membrane protein